MGVGAGAASSRRSAEDCDMVLLLVCEIELLTLGSETWVENETLHIWIIDYLLRRVAFFNCFLNVFQGQVPLSQNFIGVCHVIEDGGVLGRESQSSLDSGQREDTRVLPSIKAGEFDLHQGVLWVQLR